MILWMMNEKQVSKVLPKNQEIVHNTMLTKLSLYSVKVFKEGSNTGGIKLPLLLYL